MTFIRACRLCIRLHCAMRIHVCVCSCVRACVRVCYFARVRACMPGIRMCSCTRECVHVRVHGATNCMYVNLLTVDVLTNQLVKLKQTPVIRAGINFVVASPT